MLAVICPRWQIPDPCTRIASQRISGERENGFSIQSLQACRKSNSGGVYSRTRYAELYPVFHRTQPPTCWASIFFMIVPKSQICAWSHHHQHAPIFLRSSLSRPFEFFYALHTGVTTNLWVLHHNYGHHQHYLDQSKDQNRWQRKDGSTMGEREYGQNVAATSY